ncbi:efflux transporter outer membrane subunit [Gayadomonas joobiniege]|uniref:efflux transporter outer membrane subunit n=1 Tax=Gayadomonas joobiniege TaxID=1234606 RepID=UPI00037C5677|nr:efflux transporter outer membrane subunit [Gayadomonas joobiniege]
MNKLKPILVALSAAGLAACSLAPDYQRPSSVLEDSVSEQMVVNIPDWQAVYTDPLLQKLIEQALTNNRDIQIAQLQVAQLKQAYQIEESADWPKVAAQAQTIRQRVAQDISSTGNAYYGTTHQVNAVLTAYEIDFFGRLDNLQNAALAEYLSSQAAQATVQQNVVALVANAYFNLIQLNNYLSLQEALTESQQTSYQIYQSLAEQGVVSETDLLVIRSQMQTSKRQLFVAQDLANQAYWQLNKLLALPKDNQLLQQVRQQKLSTDQMTALPKNLPSELLRNRPDIYAAEQDMLAANANIGVARAAFYPSITLTSSIGFASTDLDNLFESESHRWSFSPQLNLPIFNAGQLDAQLEIARLQKDSSVVKYQQTVEAAFTEFYTSLETQRLIQQQLESQQALTNDSLQQVKLSQQRLAQGVESELDYQVQYRVYLTQQQALLQDQLNYLLNQVTLFKTIGGPISV